jgi:hypothetical protein
MATEQHSLPAQGRLAQAVACGKKQEDHFRSPVTTTRH